MLALLWPLHCSTSIHQGYGSCLRNSPQSRHLSHLLPRRLAHLGFVSGGCPPFSGCGPLSLSGVGHYDQFGEVQLCPGSTGPVSGDYSGLLSLLGLLPPRRESRSCYQSQKNSSPPGCSLLLPGGFLWVSSPPSPIRFTAVASACSLSSSRYIAFGTGRTLRHWCPGTSLAVRICCGGSTWIVFHGVSLDQVSPNLDFWSDALDVGWGAHLGDEVVSGRWSPEDALLSISGRELLVVEHGLLHFLLLLVSSTVTLFADNSTAVAYLRGTGGTRSPFLNKIAQRILHWAEALQIVLAPQFIRGRNNVLTDALSRPNQVQGSEWMLKMEVFEELRRRWPVMIDLFATSVSRLCSLYFSPFQDPQALGTDALLHSWDRLQIYAFPPWVLIPQVLRKLRSSKDVLMTLIAPYWPQRPWFPDLLDLAVDRPVALPMCPDLLRQPHFHRRHLGLRRLSLLAWRLSSALPGLLSSPKL